VPLLTLSGSVQATSHSQRPIYCPVRCSMVDGAARGVQRWRVVHLERRAGACTGKGFNLRRGPKATPFPLPSSHVPDALPAAAPRAPACGYSVLSRDTVAASAGTPRRWGQCLLFSCRARPPLARRAARARDPGARAAEREVCVCEHPLLKPRNLDRAPHAQGQYTPTTHGNHVAHRATPRETLTRDRRAEAACGAQSPGEARAASA